MGSIRAFISLFMLTISQLSFADEISFIEVSFEEAVALSAEESKPLFIDVYTNWCGPCHKMAAEVFTNERLASSVNANYIAVKINADEPQHESFLNSYKIGAYPTLLVYNSEIDLASKKTGFKGVAELVEWIENFLIPENNELFVKREAYQKNPFDAESVLALIDILKAYDLPFQHIAKTFVGHESFSFDNSIDITILEHAALSIDHERIREFINRNDFNTEQKQALFISIAVSYYDLAFRSRNLTIVKEFAEQHLSVFERLTGVKMDSQDIIDYLGSLHRFEI